MKNPSFWQFAHLTVVSIILALVGFYLLANYSRLFRSIKNELLRKNIIVWLIIFCFTLAMVPLTGEFFRATQKFGLANALLYQMLVVTLNTIFVFNPVRWVAAHPALRKLPFIWHKLLVLATLILTAIICYLAIRSIFFVEDKQHTDYSLLISFYVICAIGMVYIFSSYQELLQKKKFDEKELELSKLQELKTKAELEALHSKVNPHFLYNALNSIADLAITDGKKARKMTIALADLFRYSINYSQSNYSTVQDELAMTEVYLQIEKIRFEDRLTYSVSIADDTNYYLIPRFLLQPLAENAVKHGLKATGKITVIHIDIMKGEKGLVLDIADNGLPFPQELSPGYGLKSVFDKMDLLFPGGYEIHFINEPAKKVSIIIYNPKKN